MIEEECRTDRENVERATGGFVLEGGTHPSLGSHPLMPRRLVKVWTGLKKLETEALVPQAAAHSTTAEHDTCLAQPSHSLVLAQACVQ
jgi:hypothetical protein